MNVAFSLSCELYYKCCGILFGSGGLVLVWLLLVLFLFSED